MNLWDLRRSFWACKQSSSRPVVPGLPGPTVLVIDDDAVLLELMYAVLISAGFNALTSTRGTKGLVMLQQAATEVQVVLLDYQMPVLTGAQLLPCVRETAPAAKVLGLSGSDPAELPVEFRDGVDILLTKPFTRNDLIAAVTALLPAAAPGRDRGQFPQQQPACLPVVPRPVSRQPWC